MSLAVVLAHFNPVGFSNLRGNYLRTLAEFRLHLPAGCVFNGEVAYDDSPTVDPEAIRIQGSESNRWLWQKENAWSIIASQLPAVFDRIVFVDADLFFCNPLWYEQTAAALDHWDVVQPFTRCHWTSRQHQIEKTRFSIPVRGVFPDWNHAHPGFAWAFRRDVFERTGWFLHSPNGGGDSFLSWALYGDKPPYFAIQVEDQSPVYAYKQRFRGIRAAAIDGDIVHRWHGEYQDRQYQTRNAKLLAAGFNYSAVQLSPSGLLEWSDSAPEVLKNTMKKYFIRRREDG